VLDIGAPRKLVREALGELEYVEGRKVVYDSKRRETRPE